MIARSPSITRRYLVAAVLFALLPAALALGWIGPATFCLAVVGVMLVTLIVGDWPSELVVVGALVWLAVGSLVSPTPFLGEKEAAAGLANPGVVTVALLFIVAAGVQNTGVLERLATRVLGRATTERGVLIRLAAPLMGLSAFLNNTPIVALFMPLLRDWAVRRRIAPSKLLIPLSYLTIFGGVCTLIGTSTNLVVHGLMISNGLPGMSLFELGKLGIPAGLAGVIYLVVVGPRLLPSHTDMLGDPDSEVKEYLLEMEVEPGSRLHGRSIEQAGLRELDGLFLFQVLRGEQNFAPVKREFVLQEGDRLTFAGERDRVLTLNQIPGLSLPHLAHHIQIGDRSQLIEVVVSTSSPLLGRSIREVRFNRKYDATVLAIHRNGERIESALGDTAMAAGDTLLLIAGIGFRRIWQNSLDFYLVSPLRQDLGAPGRGPMALAILAAMITLSALGVVPLLVAVAVAVLALVATGCLPAQNLQRQVDWSVVAVIAAAFGISAALVNSGASTTVADALIRAASGFGPLGVLVAVYVLTSIFTEIITNNAAAAIMVPIALSAAQGMHVDPRPYALVIAVAASASFATPIGYQTNMMVYGPGGYRYADFLRIGLPLNLIYGVVTLGMAWFWWPLTPIVAAG